MQIRAGPGADVVSPGAQVQVPAPIWASPGPDGRESWSRGGRSFRLALHLTLDVLDKVELADLFRVEEMEDALRILDVRQAEHVHEL